MCPLPSHLHSIPSSLNSPTPHIQSPTPPLTPHPGTSLGSIRNRISARRVKQRDLYLDLSWDLPEGGAGHSANKTPGSKKRGADVLKNGDGLDEEEAATPSKKPRAKKAKTQAKKKEEESVEEDGSEEGGGDGKNVGVKEEVLDEELDEMV